MTSWVVDAGWVEADAESGVDEHRRYEQQAGAVQNGAERGPVADPQSAGVPGDGRVHPVQGTCPPGTGEMPSPVYDITFDDRAQLRPVRGDQHRPGPFQCVGEAADHIGATQEGQHGGVRRLSAGERPTDLGMCERRALAGPRRDRPPRSAPRRSGVGRRSWRRSWCGATRARPGSDPLTKRALGRLDGQRAGPLPSDDAGDRPIALRGAA